MRTTSSFSPSGVMRTITLRRRCRSMPTYSRCCCIGVLLRLEAVGWRTPSVSTLGPFRRGETPVAFFDDLATAASPVFGAGPKRSGPLSARATQRSFIASEDGDFVDFGRDHRPLSAND